jgi:hypothetical protein
MDVDARMQLFDLKTTYQFQTVPGICDYNMPLYGINGYPNADEPGGQPISYYPVYQGFLPPCYVNGIEVPFYTQRDSFWRTFPNYIQVLNPAGTGSGVATYTVTLPFFPAIPGHVDITGIIDAGTGQDPLVGSTLNTNVPYTSVYPGVWITAQDANGANMVIADSGQFLQGNEGYGLLMNATPGALGASLGTYSTTSNTVNYATGVVNVTFPSPVGENVDIQVQCYFYEQGLPRAILFYNNCITIRPPSNIPYLVQLDAYLTPAAFLSTSTAIPFAYMSEYLARGAAQKILSDTGDWEQFAAYEPLLIQQERFVWKRSQRIWTSTRTQTIFSDFQGPQNWLGGIGQGVT